MSVAIYFLVAALCWVPFALGLAHATYKDTELAGWDLADSLFCTFFGAIAAVFWPLVVPVLVVARLVARSIEAAR